MCTRRDCIDEPSSRNAPLTARRYLLRCTPRKSNFIKQEQVSPITMAFLTMCNALMRAFPVLQSACLGAVERSRESSTLDGRFQRIVDRL